MAEGPSGVTTRRQAKKAKEIADALQLNPRDEISDEIEDDFEEPSISLPFKNVSFAPDNT